MTTETQISPTTDTWDRRYEALVQYADREGDLLVPASHIEVYGGENVKLGNWVSYLRTRKRKGLLTPTQEKRLEVLTGWEWGPLRPGPHSDTVRDGDIMAMRESGMSLAAIGSEYGLSRQRIHQIINKERNGNG